MRGSYYNEIDPFAAQMLRNLIAARLLLESHAARRAGAFVGLRQRGAGSNGENR